MADAEIITQGLTRGSNNPIVQDAVKKIDASHSFMIMPWAESNAAMWLGLGMYALLIAYLVWDSMRAKKVLFPSQSAGA